MKSLFQKSSKVEGIYEGPYEDGQIQGNGIFTWKNGTMEGLFKDDDFVEGKITYESQIFEGKFRQGRILGKARLTNLREDYTYEGEFLQMGFHNQGKITYKDGRFYEGGWSKGKKHGEGTDLNHEGERYEGEWKDGKKHGFDKLSLKNGDVYDGAFQADLYNGRGSLLSTNGDLYEGEWKAGKRHGEGTQILKNEDKTLTGLWENDELVKDYNKKNFWQKIFGK